MSPAWIIQQFTDAIASGDDERCKRTYDRIEAIYGVDEAGPWWIEAFDSVSDRDNPDGAPGTVDQADTAEDDTADTGIALDLSDPRHRIWFDPRPGYSVIAGLDDRQRITGAYEVSHEYARRLQQVLPKTTLVIAAWGETP